MRRPSSAEYDFDRAIARLAQKYILKMIKYTGRRPMISAASPTSDGAIVATAKYVVMVKLILLTETPNVLARVGIAGK